MLHQLPPCVHQWWWVHWAATLPVKSEMLPICMVHVLVLTVCFLILIHVWRSTWASFTCWSDFYKNLCQSCRFSDSRETGVSSPETSVSSLETRLPSHETRLSSCEKQDETGNLLLTSAVDLLQDFHSGCGLGERQGWEFLYLLHLFENGHSDLSVG